MRTVFNTGNTDAPNDSYMLEVARFPSCVTVRLWEVSVVNRQSLIEPFVWLTSKMTQPPSKLFSKEICFIQCIFTFKKLK